MKTGFAVLFTMLAGAAMLTAQAGNQQPGTIFGFSSLTPRSTAHVAAHTLVIAEPPTDQHCPISMRAQHLSDGGLMKAEGAQHAAGIGQSLHLMLGNPPGQKIRSAKLAVHGYTPNGRLMRASLVKGGNADATRSLTVSFSAGEDNTVSADLWVPGMTAVQSIEVNSITYVDGSTWKFAGDLACHVTPDRSMLISAR